MTYDIRKVEYYYITVDNQTGEEYKLLSQVAGFGISLLAFTAVPQGPSRTRFALFSNDRAKMREGAKKTGLPVDGPHPALIIQGEDVAGALAGIYEKLSMAHINAYASSGIADINGRYGVVLYFSREDYEKAVKTL
jgi:hypothetical protein